jgi:hypothetical protein
MNIGEDDRFNDEVEDAKRHAAKQPDSPEVAALRANLGRFEYMRTMIDNNDDVEAFGADVSRMRQACDDVIERYEKAIERLER